MADAVDDPVTRLHISPLTPELFELLLPPSKVPKYSNLSYHSLETFPERSFAFLDVPAKTAELLKKQLNGVNIRGQKISISKARAQTWNLPAEEGVEEESRSETEFVQRLPKRQKHTVPAIQLPDGRKVQRGWTQPGKGKITVGKKKAARSAYTTQPECLFKMAPKKQASGSYKAKSTTVHEFEKTTKFPTFLKAAPPTGKPVFEYKEGVGWVDENEEVVDATVPRAQRMPVKNVGKWERSKRRRIEAEEQPSRSPVTAAESDVSAESDASDSSDETSSSDASSSSDSSSDSDAAADSDSSDSDSDSSDSSSSDDNSSEGVTEVHPLESVFKQQLQQPETEAPFSFFGADQESEAEDEVDGDGDVAIADVSRRVAVVGEQIVEKRPTIVRNLPIVPFNPDPAALLRSVITSLNLKLPEQSKSFIEEFYETRGETNRAWKQRRRDARKEQRKRENKRRAKRML